MAEVTAKIGVDLLWDGCTTCIRSDFRESARCVAKVAGSGGVNGRAVTLDSQADGCKVEMRMPNIEF